MKNAQTAAIRGMTFFWIILSVCLSGTSFANGFSRATVRPTAISVNTASELLVRAALARHISAPQTVQAQLVDDSNRVISILGTLNDEGNAGDTVADDGIYSGTFKLNESSTGQLHIRVVGTWDGTTSTSNISDVAVLPAGVPTTPRAADPDKVLVDPADGSTMVSDEIVACYSAGTTVSEIRDSIAPISGVIYGRLPLQNCYQISVADAKTSADLHHLIGVLRDERSVLTAAPDHIVPVTSVTETPPGATTSCQYPTCADTGSLSYSLLMLNGAHAASTGSGVVVGVIDSGLSIYTDQVLQRRALPGINFTLANGSSSTNTNDAIQEPHGTWVSGIIAATAPAVQIVPYKTCVYNTKEKMDKCQLSLVTSAIEEATLDPSIRALNLSLGSTTDDPSLSAAVANAISSSDILVVASAGNNKMDNDSTPYYPASYAGVVSVAGSNVQSPNNPLDDTDTIWATSFCDAFTGAIQTTRSGSNYGDISVTITAPSVCVETNGYKAKQTNFCTGTSCSTPFVVGTAALIYQLHPGWSPNQVTQQLTSSAQPIYLLNSAGEIDDQGIGPRLDALAAIGAIRITQLGYTSTTPINLKLSTSSGTTVVSASPLLGSYGTFEGNPAPCEARANATTFVITDPCVYEVAVSPTTTAGTYTLSVQLGNGSSADFFGSVALTLPGLTLVSANTSNAFIENPQLGTVTLEGSDARTATFSLSYAPQQ